MMIPMLIAVLAGAALGAGIAAALKAKSPGLGALAGAFVAVLVASAIANNRVEEFEGTITAIESEEQFNTLGIRQDMPVVVDFFATWCGPCKRLAPLMEELKTEYEGQVQFLKVDVDKMQTLANTYNVHAYPTVILLVDGVEAHRWRGLKRRQEYSGIIDEAIAAKANTSAESNGL